MRKFVLAVITIDMTLFEFVLESELRLISEQRKCSLG